MKTFHQFLEEVSEQPRKFETDQPIQQQIDQLVKTLQMKLNANPYLDVRQTIDFYDKKLNYTYGPKAAEFWRKRVNAMIQNMQSQFKAFNDKTAKQPPLR